jgi:DNA-binding MarR family transcriptional regulator
MNEQNTGMMEIFMGMAQVTRCCRQDVAFCEGVTFHQFMILDAVAKDNELNMADLRKILSVEKSTTTRLVNPLIQKGLLRRDQAIHDSRAVTLFLTPEGKAIHQKVSLCLAGFFQKITKNIPEGKKADVLESINIFINAIKNSAAGYTCCDELPAETGKPILICETPPMAHASITQVEFGASSKGKPKG